MNADDQAEVHGTPGEGARMAGMARAFLPLCGLLTIAGYLAGAMTRWPRFTPAAAGIALVGVAAVILVGVRHCRRRVEAFFKGADGEERVGRMLARLPAGWHVFHSVETGGGVGMWRRGDIDHVVVAPGGLFAIETKNWRARVTLDGACILQDGQPPRRQPLDQVRASAQALARRLADAGIEGAPPVQVVCFANDRLVGGYAQAGAAWVCNGSLLLTVLREAAGRMTQPFDAARAVAVLRGGPPLSATGTVGTEREAIC